MAHLWAFVSLFLLIEASASGGQPNLAVLRLEPVKGGGATNYNAVLADWSSLDEKVTAAPVVRPSDPYGCSRHSRCSGCALLVQQGNCTFWLKAQLASAAGAKLLIVATAAEGPPVAMGTSSQLRGRKPPVVTISVSKATARKLSLALEKDGESIASAWRQERNVIGDIASEVIVGVLAVSLVMLGAWFSVEDLRVPGSSSRLNEEVVAVEEKSGFHFLIFGSLMLTVLFFFMKYLIYGLLLMFAFGAVSTTTLVCEPFVFRIFPMLRRKRACKLPQRIADLLGVAEEHTMSDGMAEVVGVVLAVAFLVYRNNDAFGWILQDTIAVMLLLTIQRTMRLPNLKVGTMLLVCTFFFDIFWVFLSPLIFKKSVMIEVATGGGTGQSVPMVLKIPAMASSISGQFKILGFGDIAIPGLLIAMLLRHDLVKRSRRFRGYFTAGVIGYSLGLAATFVSLYLMQHGQPALLFLVPGTLIPTFLIARRKGEVQAFWNANYGPETDDAKEVAEEERKPLLQHG